MRLRWTTTLLLTALGGCSVSSNSQNFSVYFTPYSAQLDQQARDTIQTASSFAHAHETMPILLSGYAAPPDPKLDVDGLSAQRADTIKQALLHDGIAAERISTVAKGIIDPKTLPSAAVRRVDIKVGRSDANETSASGGGFK